ncbi:SDR family oxidoreductase [Streptomyces sp. AC563]|uniref:SDR family NAD(P)-dependent oxidoreductase n=1 Tax=Streptomyces buecherae TaxID=2763006 RepID=UPI00164E04EF|nr:SDR family oxidoreductase [Streptomyces buecherae]MBC3990229.1 SDR family oxidoreductase [Streptomyces buecherae]
MGSGKIALITGGNRGLGRATAQALARHGLRVIVTYRGDAQAAEEVVDSVRESGATVAALRLDISDVASFPAFVSHLTTQLERWDATRLNVLVNNAGIGLFGPLEAVTVDDYDAVMNTNVRGTFFLTQALAPVLADGGRIINVSSSLSRHTSAGTSVYSASKAAVEVLSRTLAVELGPRRIRVNAIAPGPTATDFNGGAMRDDARLRENLGAQTALGRVGEPREIGDAIAALASDDLRWVTAQRLEVSGGALL